MQQTNFPFYFSATTLLVAYQLFITFLAFLVPSAIAV